MSSTEEEQNSSKTSSFRQQQIRSKYQKIKGILQLLAFTAPRSRYSTLHSYLSNVSEVSIARWSSSKYYQMTTGRQLWLKATDLSIFMLNMELTTKREFLTILEIYSTILIVQISVFLLQQIKSIEFRLNKENSLYHFTLTLS